MSLLRRTFGFAFLARVLILAFGLGLAFDLAPVNAAPTQICGGDCMMQPVEEPRERESVVLGILTAAIESVQSEAAGEAAAPVAPCGSFNLPLSSPIVATNERSPAPPHGVPPDKTGPPRA